MDEAAASILQPYDCPAPAVVSFSALPATLTAAGAAQLNWYAEGATSVTIDQGVGGGASGSATVRLAAGTTFHLTAQNACGTAAASLTVPVGAPTLTGITPSNPTPGQTATLALGNVVDITKAQSATLMCGTSTAARPVSLSVDASGNVTFVVPFVQDGSFPAGYWNGSCTLAVGADSGQSAPFKFNIAPLTYAGDPVAAFKTLVANLQQQAHAAFADQAGLDPFQQVAGALDPVIDQWAAQLNQMASDISANGTATVPVDVPTKSQPNPPTFTITRAQLTEVVAYLNASAPGMFVPARTPSLSHAKARAVAPSSYHDDGSAACLIRDMKIGPLYSQCLAVAGSEAVDLALTSLLSSALNGCTVTANIPYLAGKLLQIASSPQYVCGVLPVTWTGFFARQTPLQIDLPLGPANTSGNLGTHVMATLNKAFSVSQQSAVGQQLVNIVVQALSGTAKASGCSSLVQPQIAGLFTPLMAAVGDAAGQYLAQVSAQYPTSYNAEVYKCDLSSVTPANPAELKPRPDLEQPTVAPYYFDGLQQGPALLTVRGYPGNFIFPASFGFYIAPPPPGSVPVSQALANVDNRPKLEVINQSAYTYDADNPGEIPSPPLTVLTTPMPVVSTYSVGSGGLFAPASATAVVTPTGNNSWKLSVVAAAYHDDNTYKAQIQSHASLGVNAINQAPFGLKSHIMIDAKMDTTPVCPKTPLVCSFPQGQILVVDANGKSTSVVLNSGSNPFPLMVDSSASAGSPVFIEAGLENTPVAGGGTTTFRIDLTIQFLDN
jgi:hypothetical protein